jgi:hypothetical protein
LAQWDARPQLGAEVATRRLLRCRAPKRTALETPALGDRRGSRIGWTRRLGACARRRTFAVDLPLPRGDDIGPGRRRGQRGRRRGIGAAGRAEKCGGQVLVLVVVGSLSKSDLLRSALGQIGHARRMMRMCRLSVVLRQVLVDNRMRNSPCGLSERGQQQCERPSASRQSEHGRKTYPRSRSGGTSSGSRPGGKAWDTRTPKDKIYWIRLLSYTAGGFESRPPRHDLRHFGAASTEPRPGSGDAARVAHVIAPAAGRGYPPARR